MHSTVMGSRHIVMGDRCSVVGCVPRNLGGVIGHRSQGIRWALLPGARSRAKAWVQAGGAGKGRQLRALRGGMGHGEVAGGEGSWHGNFRGRDECRWGLRERS